MNMNRFAQFAVVVIRNIKQCSQRSVQSVHRHWTSNMTGRVTHNSDTANENDRSEQKRRHQTATQDTVRCDV